MPSTRTSKVLSSHRHNVSVALAAVSCAVAIAACGSSGSSSGAAASSGSTQGVRYADCMRSHGAPNFPDPNADGSVNLPSGINSASPAFQAAQQACASLQPNANGPRPAITAAQQKSFVANAQCMRKHGVPNFPDPVFGTGGQGIGYNVPPGAFAYETQGVLRASRECRNVGSPLPLRYLTQAAS
jgi:hypothetical protein